MVPIYILNFIRMYIHIYFSMKACALKIHKYKWNYTLISTQKNIF